MATWRIHFKSKKGDQYMLVDAPSKEKAEQEAKRAQQRRHERFPMTFNRLNQSLDSGELHPMLAIDPRIQNLRGKELKPFLNAELERRKKDQSRYDDDDLKVVSVEKI